MREALVAPFSTYQMRMRPDLQLTLRANPSQPPPTSRAAVETRLTRAESALIMSERVESARVVGSTQITRGNA